MITCIIRYDIDPWGRDAFVEYARAWGEAIPACGADLIGYFAPHEGSATTAYGIYSIENLAEYEAYRSTEGSPAGSPELRFRARASLHPVRGPRFLRASRPVIAVIFEVEPADGRRDTYLDIAAKLKPELEAIPGFLSVERFESLTRPGKILSLSFFRDEAAVKAWRGLPSHRAAQAAGRGGVFRDYRLRVAEVLRGYGLTERDEAPDDSRAAHQP